MSNFNVFGIGVSSWIFVPVVFFVWVTVLFFVKQIFFKTIKRIAEKQKQALMTFLSKRLIFL